LVYDEGEVVFNFGKYEGRKVSEIAKSDNYVDWLVNKSSESYEVKNILKILSP